MRKRLLAAGFVIACVAANPMPAEFAYSFRNGVSDHPLLKLTGPAARQVAKPDGKGLRISLSGKRKDMSGSIAVGPAFTIRGDCEITLGYDALTTEGDLPPNGAGLHFVVKVDGPEAQAVSITRLRKPGPDGQPPVETLGANVITRGPDGKEKYSTKVLPAAAKSGRLRFEREGGLMRMSAADGTGPFQVIREAPVGTGDLHSLTARCGSSTGGLDVRLVDLTVRAESLGNEATSVEPDRGWPTWLKVTGVLLGLVVGGVALRWYLARRRARVPN